MLSTNTHYTTTPRLTMDDLTLIANIGTNDLTLIANIGTNDLPLKRYSDRQWRIQKHLKGGLKIV